MHQLQTSSCTYYSLVYNNAIQNQNLDEPILYPTLFKVNIREETLKRWLKHRYYNNLYQSNV